MLRVIQEIRPAWVVGENVSGLIRDALDEILESIEKDGYEARAYAFKACEVGALFAGERIAIVAKANNGGTVMWRNIQFPTDDASAACGNYNGRGTPEPYAGKWRQIESRPYGVANGVPSRVDRLKCLGNAVVPQQFFRFLRRLRR